MKPNNSKFEQDLRYILGDELKNSEFLCEDLWSALSNVTWYHLEDQVKADYSFRSAGGLVAELAEDDSDYMDWYCCAEPGVVSNKIALAMKKMGWIYDTTPEPCCITKCHNPASYFTGKGKQYCVNHSSLINEE